MFLPIDAQYDLHADGTHLQLTGRRVLYHARARALMEGMLGEYMAHMVWRNAGCVVYRLSSVSRLSRLILPRPVHF